MGLAFTVPAMVIAGALVVYHLQAARRFLADEGVRYGTILSDQILNSAQRFLRLGSIAAVQEMIEETGSQRSVLAIALIDGDGRILASNRHDWIGVHDTAILDADYPAVSRDARVAFQPRHRVIDGGKRILLVSPLLFQGADPILGRSRGTLYMKVDHERRLREAFADILARGVVSAVAIVLVSLLLFAWVRAILALPILRIAAFLRRFAAGLDTVPPPPSGPKEVAALAGDVAAMVRDLREKQTELADSEERHRSLLQGAWDAILTVDPESGRVLEANAMFCRLFGYSPAEAATLTVADLHPPEDRARILPAYAEAARTGDKDFHAIPCVRRDGSRFMVDVRGGPIRLRQRTVIEWIVRDRTERQHLEDQLRLAQRMESVGTLAGGMAHDFNNLLTGILGYTRLMLGRAQPEDPQVRQLRVIERSAMRAADLTAQLQAFSRRAAARPEPGNIGAILAPTIEDLRQALPPGVACVVETVPDLWTTTVDPGQIQAALRQLWSNALDAMPAGGRLTLRIANREIAAADSGRRIEARAGRFVVLSVEDSGTGVSPAIRDRIFEPFFTTKEAGKGSGLGLSMVYGMAKAHDGWVEVESAPGRGSRFAIHLPEYDAAAARVQIDSPAVVLARLTGVAPASTPALTGPAAPPAGPAPGPVATPAAGGPGSSAAAAPATRPGRSCVLAVDDESTVLVLAKDILEMHGHTVLTARNGEEAIRLYAARPKGIDVVLLDLTMPLLGGRECLKRILAIDPKARVVISSGFSEEATVRDLLADGAVDYIQKPYDIEVLARVINQAIAGEGRSAAMTPKAVGM
jgi:PAS domain S-box-containing protein